MTHPYSAVGAQLLGSLKVYESCCSRTRPVRGLEHSLVCCYHNRTSSHPPAFVFDIDGVLIRGKSVLDAAKRALARLFNAEGSEPAYPVCFLTNGGGVLEAKKAEQLSEWLGVSIRAKQVILSHTPFKQLPQELKDSPVVIAGRQDIEHIAKAYGFNRTVTTSQLAASNPSAVPFAPVAASSSKTVYGTKDQPIKAVLVFSDPSNWYLDLQIVTDVVTSGGILDRKEALAGSEPVQIFFSNPDQLFANEHHSPRFGQGAFAIALRALLREIYRQEPENWKTFGKPNPEPYQLAQAVLAAEAKALGLAPHPVSNLPYSAIFMVGDNPASDVAGARAAGDEILLANSKVASLQFQQTPWIIENKATKNIISKNYFNMVQYIELTIPQILRNARIYQAGLI